MLTYKLLAALLDYPGSEIVDDLRTAVAEEGGALGLLRSVDTDEVFSEAEHISIAGFIDDFIVFLVPYVANPLKEQQWEDVGFEIGRVDRTTQDIGRLP